MINTHCPVCGHPFSPIDVVLAEHEVSYQCRHCWNRVRATGAGTTVARFAGAPKPRLVSQKGGARRAAGPLGKKS